MFMRKETFPTKVIIDALRLTDLARAEVQCSTIRDIHNCPLGLVQKGLWGIFMGLYRKSVVAILALAFLSTGISQPATAAQGDTNFEVVLPSGKPAVGVRVSVSSDKGYGSAMTGADGIATLVGIVGKASVSVNACGQVGSSVALSYTTDLATGGSALRIVIPRPVVSYRFKLLDDKGKIFTEPPLKSLKIPVGLSIPLQMTGQNGIVDTQGFGVGRASRCDQYWVDSSTAQYDVYGSTQDIEFKINETTPTGYITRTIPATQLSTSTVNIITVPSRPSATSLLPKYQAYTNQQVVLTGQVATVVSQQQPRLAILCELGGVRSGSQPLASLNPDGTFISKNVWTQPGSLRCTVADIFGLAIWSDPFEIEVRDRRLIKLSNTKYPNCKALNKVFPGGVTNKQYVQTAVKENIPFLNLAAYAKNRALDPKKTGIACGK